MSADVKWLLNGIPEDEYVQDAYRPVMAGDVLGVVTVINTGNRDLTYLELYDAEERAEFSQDRVTWCKMLFRACLRPGEQWTATARVRTGNIGEGVIQIRVHELNEEEWDTRVAAYAGIVLGQLVEQPRTRESWWVRLLAWCRRWRW